MAQAPKAELVGSLLSLVAHDLRNPLSALHSNVGFLESLVDGADTDAREALADVAASCGSLKHIIDNLELLGMFVQGSSLVLERGPIVLGDLVTEVVTRLRSVAESYGVTLALDAEVRRDIRVKAHREMLGRALGNLLFNSIQHGGSTSPITVSVSSEGTHGVVVCTDGGSLLADDLRTEAFTAQGQIACKSDAFGRYSRGLGLFSARIAAELAGVEVCALDPDGGKNRFELRAPIT